MTVPDSQRMLNTKDATIAMFQYTRQIMKPDSNIDAQVPDAFGFEGSMNGDFYHSVLNAYLESSQTIRVEGGVQSDYPVARICAITSTNFVITQCFRRIGNRVDVKKLDPSLFKLLIDDGTYEYSYI